MPAKIELKPCPFCGGRAKVSLNQSSIAYDKPIDYTYFAICCESCEAEISNPEKQEGLEPEEMIEIAAKAWNTRASGWISCEKRMPDAPGIHVMVTDGVHIMESFYEAIDGEMLWLDNSLDLRFGKVTHWMPLPELPKGV